MSNSPLALAISLFSRNFSFVLSAAVKVKMIRAEGENAITTH